jgi:phosphoglycerol transferase MdoB-like AlkP superfamily enzyme
MSNYRDVRGEDAAKKNQEATELFERGTRAREHADDYVRLTVFLATVLLLVAISQRFQSHRIRVALAIIALLMVCVPIWQLIILPRM